MRMLTLYRLNEKIAECEMNTDQEIVIGRDKSCHLVIDDQLISRRHFQCSFKNDQWQIKCLARFSQLKDGSGHSFSQKEINSEEPFECWMGDYRIYISLDGANGADGADGAENQEAMSHNNTSLMVLEGQDAELQDSLPEQDTPEDMNENHLEGIPSTEEEDPNRTSLMPINDSPNEIANDMDEHDPESEPDPDQTQFVQQGLHAAQLEARLKVLRKMGQEDVFVLHGTKWVIGRSEDCEITLNHPKVSRMHFEITYSQDEYYIKDLKSSNGTHLNGTKITHLKPTLLHSSDRINIEDLIFCFEICNVELEKKLEILELEEHKASSNSSLPLNLSTAQIDLATQEKSSEGVVRIPSPIADSGKKKKKFIRIALIGLVFVFVAMSLSEEPAEDTSQKEKVLLEEDNEFNNLTPQQKTVVDNSHRAAKQMYDQGKFNIALNELQKLHEIISAYKDSRDLEKFSIAALDTIKKNDEIRQATERQEQLVKEVTNVIDLCTKEAKTHTDIDRLQTCLDPALELDPENARIQILLEEMKQKIAESKTKEQNRRRYLASVQSGKKLYEAAKALHDDKQLLDAIDAYQKHIKSKYPDPDKLKEKSEESIDKIRQIVNVKIDFYHDKANEKIEAKDYRTAILLLKKSLDLDPTLVSSKKKMAEYSDKLTKQMKDLYAESVLEESLGNIEDAKKKWKDIVNLDVRYGKYYKKAKKKLKQYL